LEFTNMEAKSQLKRDENETEEDNDDSEEGEEGKSDDDLTEIERQTLDVKTENEDEHEKWSLFF